LCCDYTDCLKLQAILTARLKELDSMTARLDTLTARLKDNLANYLERAAAVAHQLLDIFLFFLRAFDFTK